MKKFCLPIPMEDNRVLEAKKQLFQVGMDGA